MTARRYALAVICCVVCGVGCGWAGAGTTKRIKTEDTSTAQQR